MLKLAAMIDRLNNRIGRFWAWALVAMMLIQFTVVVMRYIFSIGSIKMQESVIYLHASLFMIAAAYTLLHDGHVRIDIFYRPFSPRKKAWVNLTGSVVFLIPVCVLIIATSWGYVAQSWAALEGSRETSGIHAVYLLKTCIPLFGLLVGLQGVALAMRSFLTLTGATTATGEGGL